jgi:hypothetical protein
VATVVAIMGEAARTRCRMPARTPAMPKTGRVDLVTTGRDQPLQIGDEVVMGCALDVPDWALAEPVE